MTTDEKEGCEILAEFIGLTFQPVMAGFELGSSYMSYDQDFTSRKDCLAFCDQLNERRDPNECYFPLPKTPKFELHYHDKIEWLWPVWVKFRGLTFESYLVEFSHKMLCDIIAHVFRTGEIPDIFRALVDGVKWFNSIKEETKFNNK